MDKCCAILLRLLVEWYAFICAHVAVFPKVELAIGVQCCLDVSVKRAVHQDFDQDDLLYLLVLPIPSFFCPLISNTTGIAFCCTVDSNSESR